MANQDFGNLSSVTWHNEETATLRNFKTGEKRRAFLITMYHPKTEPLSIFVDSFGEWWALFADMQTAAQILPKPETETERKNA